MRIVVLSDSHGDIRSIERALEGVGKYDAVIHLGDTDRDVRALEHSCDVPVYAVLGNNDFYGRELDRVLELGGVRIFICHGHTYGVRSGTGRLLTAAKTNNCSAALFGHTHIPLDKTEDGILLFNPGSCSRPRVGNPSFGVLEIENGKCSSVVVDWIL